MRGIVEVVAEIELHADDDLYRFGAPTDVTGENLYRVALSRLDNLDALLDDPRFDASLDLARARSLERLSDFDGATARYEAVAAGTSPLAATAIAALPLARELRDLTAPLDANALTPDDVLTAVDRNRELLVALLDANASDPRRSLIEVAIERQDVRSREFLWRTRALVPDGAARALAFASEVVERHPESVRVHAHRLRLADMYAELARGYVEAVNPAGYEFDAARLANMVQAASALYAEIATLDGRPEREEARAGLASMEALAARARTP